MKKLITFCLVATIVLAISSITDADWQPDQPAKWAQLPDLSTNGIDVLATGPIILADDFLCTSNNPITSIHIWGSWLGDYLPTPPTGGQGDPTNVSFRLSIHADIPANQSPTGYSMPGELLDEWIFSPGTFSAREYATDINEGWLNPPDEYLPSADTIAWQYNFILDEPFYQQGTSNEPIVYWLDVSADPNDDQALFGWKTSIDHWNDDAVWLAPGADWQELYYPPNIYQGESIDLAFVIVPEPATMTLLGLGSLILLRKRRA